MEKVVSLRDYSGMAAGAYIFCVWYSLLSIVIPEPYLYGWSNEMILKVIYSSDLLLSDFHEYYISWKIQRACWITIKLVLLLITNNNNNNTASMPCSNHGNGSTRLWQRIKNMATTITNSLPNCLLNQISFVHAPCWLKLIKSWAT